MKMGRSDTADKLKLIKITKSPKPTKKLRAVFDIGGRKKTVDFGAAGMTDYLLSGDVEKRELYRERHKKDLETHDPSKAGFLSYYILWGPHTTLQQNIDAYMSRFGLH
jgi:ABC-type sulfate transport system substrate-binding protein